MFSDSNFKEKFKVGKLGKVVKLTFQRGFFVWDFCVGNLTFVLLVLFSVWNTCAVDGLLVFSLPKLFLPTLCQENGNFGCFFELILHYFD